MINQRVGTGEEAKPAMHVNYRLGQMYERVLLVEKLAIAVVWRRLRIRIGCARS